MVVRILVVDDEPDVRALLADLLRAHGNDVTEASSPREALQEAAAAAPSILVTDYRMPEMDGLELARRMRLEVPGLKVLLITAFADSTLGSGAVERGEVDRFCRKTVDPKELLRVVDGLA